MMKYGKLYRNMQRSDLEYSIEDRGAAVHIETLPDRNQVALESISAALGRKETCVNSSPGRFSIVRTDIKIYRSPIED